MDTVRQFRGLGYVRCAFCGTTLLQYQPRDLLLASFFKRLGKDLAIVGFCDFRSLQAGSRTNSKMHSTHCPERNKNTITTDMGPN